MKSRFGMAPLSKHIATQSPESHNNTKSGREPLGGGKCWLRRRRHHAVHASLIGLRIQASGAVLPNIFFVGAALISRGRKAQDVSPPKLCLPRLKLDDQVFCLIVANKSQKKNRTGSPHP